MRGLGSYAAPLLIFCCAGTLRAEDLVDFKLVDSALVLKVPRAWALREGLNSFGISFPSKDGFAASFSGGIISHSTRAQLLESSASSEANKLEKKELVTASGLKGHALTLLRERSKEPNAPKEKLEPVAHTSYLIVLNEVDVALLSFERLQNGHVELTEQVNAVVQALTLNPEFVPPIPGAVYKSTRGKFSLTPPLFLAMLPVNGSYRAGVEPGVPAARGLRIERVAEPRALNEVTNARIQFLRKEAPKASFPLITPFKTEQGIEGQRFETNTILSEKEKIHHVQYFFLKNGDLLTLSCNFYTRNEAESRAAFDACAKSLSME